jgi:hypothetical protein
MLGLFLRRSKQGKKSAVVAMTQTAPPEDANWRFEPKLDDFAPFARRPKRSPQLW